MKSLAVLFLLFFGFEQLNAQYSENVISDRPGMSWSSFTVGKNVWQVQSGIDYYEESYVVGNLNTLQSGQVLNTLIRYGLLERFECALGFNLRADQIKVLGSSSGKYGVNGLATHFRGNLSKEGKVMPSIALQFSLAFPYATGTYSERYFTPRLAMHLDKTLFKKWTVTINTAGEYRNDQDLLASYTFSLGYVLNKKSSVFAENYTYISNGKVDYKFDVGFAYLLKSNIQLDLSVGYDKNKDHSEAFFISTGISWRFDKNWKHKIVERKEEN